VIGSEIALSIPASPKQYKHQHRSNE